MLKLFELLQQEKHTVTSLSQRYNNVWVKGGAVPSSEADSRAFSFDIIPSSQIDNLTIVKSPTAEYPADYSGGFIIVNTKEIPETGSQPEPALDARRKNTRHARRPELYQRIPHLREHGEQSLWHL